MTTSTEPVPAGTGSPNPLVHDWLPDVVLSQDPVADCRAADALVVPFDVQDGCVLLGPEAEQLTVSVPDDLVALLEHRGATGRAGETVEHVVVDPDRGDQEPRPLSVVLVGVGRATPTDLRRAAAAAARRTEGCARVVTSLGAVAHDAGLRAVVEGLLLGRFRYDLKTATRDRTATSFALIGLRAGGSREAAVRRGVATATAGATSRRLALVPSNIKSPAWLAEQATVVAEETGLEVEVFAEDRLAAEGFGGILGVGQASDHPPRLVRLAYEPEGAGRRTPHVVLVGKGITFDSGGLSIKPADAMATMKRDMTGAGVVLSTMSQLAALDCRVRVTGLLACAENAISGRALRPGDVLRHYGGRTSEVRNTDAEGRLVLADAMAYAVAHLKPTVLVDVATLTGAMKMSLGQRTGGLFSNDDELAAHLLAASRVAGEPLWRMPLVDDYEERLESTVADADNAAGPPGAITAALFLRHFAGDVPWAHLDIASAGDWPVDAFEWTQGASGFGARALLHWLETRRPLAGVGARRSRR